MAAGAAVWVIRSLTLVVVSGLERVSRQFPMLGPFAKSFHEPEKYDPESNK